VFATVDKCRLHRGMTEAPSVTELRHLGGLFAGSVLPRHSLTRTPSENPHTPAFNNR
jgi:hypothetical protein